MQDYRSIPIEVLRDFARTQAEITSIRLAAEDAGVGRSTLHKFILGKTMPHPRVRRRLGLWYLARQDGAQDIDIIRPYVAAFSLLTSDLPAEQQAAASCVLLDSLEAVYVDVRPRWLEVLERERRRIDEQTGRRG